MKKAAILGAGLAGLSTAYHLGQSGCHDYVILEKACCAGGLCRSERVAGHTFDIGGGHVIFTRNDYAKGLIAKLLGNNLIEHKRRSLIFLYNRYVEYPFEVNLRSLPKHVIAECIEGVMKRPTGKPKNFEQWIYSTFGRGIAKHYMIPYNRKIWKYDLKKMSLGWLGGRVPAPNVAEMRKGARQKTGRTYGANATFWYPRHGGIQALSDSLAAHVRNISLNSKVERIEISETKPHKIYYDKAGKRKKVEAKYIFTSLPLPELIPMLDAPSDVRRAAKQLFFNSITCVVLSVKGKIPRAHWIYYPERDTIFHRAILASNFSPFVSPKGESTIILELTHRTGYTEKLAQKAIEDARKLEFLRKREPKLLNIYHHKYAYVIHDLGCENKIQTIHRYLLEQRIIPVGRFAQWEYFNMDQTILEGREACRALIGEIQ